MVQDDLPLLIGFVVMSLASLGIYAHGSKHPEIRHHTQFHSVVPFIAATAYLAMALGLGKLTIHGDETLYLARYADWSVTTPILLTGLVLTGLHEHHRHSSYLLPVLVLDMLMIVTGLLSALSENLAERWIWYGWSCVAFLGVLYLLWKPVRDVSRAMGGHMDSIYNKNLVFLTVVWLAYPAVFFIGPQGVGITNALANVWLILVLDIIAKVVYGFVSTSHFKKIPEAELRREERLS